MVRPTKVRFKKISHWVNVVQLCFYCLIGVSGYMSFLGQTNQDIITSYGEHDPMVSIGRAFLTCSMLVAIPINLLPTVRSGLQFKAFFSPNSPPLLLPSPEP